jgi:ATP-dependent helicase YprA (DUF1998 family)/very-short-patch-repair endonuclease
MNVFEFRNRLIMDYSKYVRGFINIQDEHLAQHVDQGLDAGVFWPEPLIQLNPSFEPGARIEDLVDARVLHETCVRMFRKDKDNPAYPGGRSLRLHKHQEEAIRQARGGANYVLTTGTGSGKSLAYIVPIVDHVLRRGPGRGIQAIVIYPMNALANSQENELRKFLHLGFSDNKGPVTFRKYTGQENDEEREKIIADPPDILLTNYVMLELLLTRPHEKRLIEAAKGLKFLVLDELHTYRGRQGSDVALLVRRVKEAMHADELQYVGTSATLAGAGTFVEQQRGVAAMASLLFGSEVKPEHVIGETLKRTTAARDITAPDFVELLRHRISDTAAKPPEKFADFVSDPLSVWLEDTFGLVQDSTSGRIRRRDPRGIQGEDGAAANLNALTGVPLDRCVSVIQEGLLAGFRCERNPETGFPPFAFRLHQFIGRGDTVYASLEAPADRYVTFNRQQFVPGDREKILLPLAFCRECGQEYYAVQAKVREDGRVLSVSPREIGDQSDDGIRPGYLHVSDENPWPSEADEVSRRLPDDWLEETAKGQRVKSDRKSNVPQPVTIGTDGVPAEPGLLSHFILAPFRFCLNCGVSYDFRQKNDFAKLATLSSEGRSTATTILSMAAIRHLKAEPNILEKARKLLSFTDNRQDASLQAGHFNDFVEIGVLRSALARAVEQSAGDGIQHELIVEKVYEALDLPFAHYAANPAARFHAENETRRAFQKVLGYRLYRDLKRGWRLSSPNLEQCGLLEIRYNSLDEVCGAEDLWQGFHQALVTASPETRAKIMKTLLDFMRRALAIRVDYLDEQDQERIRQLSSQYLVTPWGFDENETLEHATILLPRPMRAGETRENIFLSSYSGFARYLRRKLTPGLKRDDIGTIIQQLLGILSREAGLLAVVAEPADPADVPGYQILASAMRWVAGDGTRAFHDPIRVPNESKKGHRTNPFFVDFYRAAAAGMAGLKAREHTAQVNNEDRQKREDDFREGRLPVLYCSPTMELGIDIAELNLVNMRNVPPTPANYAQRSGRAGRSGQPAFVFSYCTTGSPHDQYFFRRPEQMVSGSVTPPRMDLANEDLVRAHVHAVWLAETGQSLGKSLKDILDLSGNPPSLGLLASVKASIESEKARATAKERAKRVLSSIEKELSASYWYAEKWLDEALQQVCRAFDATCTRWRDLYRAARGQMENQHRIMLDHSRSAGDRDLAARLYREARVQLGLLTEVENIVQSDFYSYRYFASEGFLPGYNFPRLPLSAFIPGRKTANKQDEYLSRPRFLAITEFGPRAFVYHEGSKYVINRVILPVSDDENQLTRRAKRCGECGYLHPLSAGETKDLCDHCRAELTSDMCNLFRMQNVVTKRRERINSDEEERMRLGFEVISGFRFTEHGMRPSSREAQAEKDGDVLAKLTYGHAATLWRINLGWTRRANPNQFGFMLDVERGYWARNEVVSDDNEPPDPMAPRVERVIPYVEDRRNCLVFAPNGFAGEKEMPSLQSVLKNAIQIYFQLEENEIAAEPLPSKDDRRAILFYESAEGGAGVLRRLLDDPKTLRQVAKTALDLCHFDPETGADRRRPPRSKEDCEAACYDCLMSYGNQRDHAFLDRMVLKDYLLALAGGTVVASPGPLPRADHLERLKRASETGLEKKWLDFIDGRWLHLPTHGQKLVVECSTQPDFIYANSGNLAAIYVDGPIHDFPDRHKRDVQKTAALEDLGYLVIRFRHDDDWGGIVAKYPSIFGSGK